RNLVEEDDEGLYAGRGEPGGLGVPAAGRERRAHRFRGVRSERRQPHVARRALTMFRRAARTAGRKPPTTRITTAKTRARASTTDSTRNAPKTLRRLNPRARRVPTSTVRFATAAYIVIIAPIMAPKLKIVVTTIPSVRMNVARVLDCSW